jgi:hypothetical protein
MFRKNMWPPSSGSKNKPNNNPRRWNRYEGADKSLALQRKQQATGSKKWIYSIYSPPSFTHLWPRCSNSFNPFKKNYFGCAANRKSQNPINTLTYVPPKYQLTYTASYRRRDDPSSRIRVESYATWNALLSIRTAINNFCVSFVIKLIW